MKARAPGAPESLGADHLTEPPTLQCSRDAQRQTPYFRVGDEPSGMRTEGRFLLLITSKNSILLPASSLAESPGAGRCSIVLHFAHRWHTLDSEDAWTLEQADDHQSVCIRLPACSAPRTSSRGWNAGPTPTATTSTTACFCPHSGTPHSTPAWSASTTSAAALRPALSPTPGVRPLQLTDAHRASFAQHRARRSALFSRRSCAECHNGIIGAL